MYKCFMTSLTIVTQRKQGDNQKGQNCHIKYHALQQQCAVNYTIRSFTRTVQYHFISTAPVRPL